MTKRAEAAAAQEVVWQLVARVHQHNLKVDVEALRSASAKATLASLVQEGVLDEWDVEHRLLLWQGEYLRRALQEHCATLPGAASHA